MQFADIKLDQGSIRDGEVPAPVQVIAITGAHTGSGKSSIAVNLAQALSMAGQHTLLLDADPVMSNINDLLGLSPVLTLFDVLSGDRRLDEVLLDGPAGIRIVPATVSGRKTAGIGPWECAGLVRAFSDISTPVDTLVIDTASGVEDCTTRLCRAATEVVVVMRSDRTSLRGAVALIETLHREDGISRFRVLPSRVGSSAEAGELFAQLLQYFAGNHEIALSCCGFIPDDEFMARAGDMKCSVISAFPRSRSSMALNNLAYRVMKWPRNGQAGGHLEFFVERLIQNENMEMEVGS